MIIANILTWLTWRSGLALWQLLVLNCLLINFQMTNSLFWSNTTLIFMPSVSGKPVIIAEGTALNGMCVNTMERTTGRWGRCLGILLLVQDLCPKVISAAVDGVFPLSCVWWMLTFQFFSCEHTRMISCSNDTCCLPVPAFDVHMNTAELETSSAISVASQQESPPRYLLETYCFDTYQLAMSGHTQEVKKYFQF